MKRRPKLTRRSFLRSVIAAGAAPAVVPSSVLGANAPSHKITLGVIGVGAQGKQDMMNFLGLENEVRVTAICDINQRNIDDARKRIAGAYGSADVVVHSDFRELNDDSGIDAVLMALPVHWHSIPALDAILRDPKNKDGTMPVKLPASNHHARNFIEAIRNGTRSICDIESAVRSDTLCQTALIAVKQGRKLQWDPATERFVNDAAANKMLQPRTFRGDWKLQSP